MSYVILKMNPEIVLMSLNQSTCAVRNPSAYESLTSLSAP